MGIRVKHVVVVSAVLSAVGFGYVVGFAEIDVVASPRAGALGVRADVGRMIGNLRASMIAGQEVAAMRTGDAMVEQFPQDARAHLHRGFAYRMAGMDTETVDAEGRRGGFEGWRMLRVIVGQRDMGDREGTALGDALYERGWSYRGSGELVLSRADFLELARMTEGAIGVGSVIGANDQDDEDDVKEGGIIMGPDMLGAVGAGSAYNLACYWALAGDVERALVYWRVCVDGGYGTAGLAEGWWRVDPDFEELWNDERFWEIGERIR